MKNIGTAFYVFIGIVLFVLAITHLFMGAMWVVLGITGGSFDIYGSEHLSTQLNKQEANVLLRNVYNNLFAPDVSYLNLLKIWSTIGAVIGGILAVLALIPAGKKESTIDETDE